MWKSLSGGKMECSFKDKTLAEIMQILERWYGVNVIFQDESLKELEYTGSLERYDSIIHSCNCWKN